MYVTQTNNRTDLFSLEISYVKNVPYLYGLRKCKFTVVKKIHLQIMAKNKNLPVPMAFFENLNIFNKLVFKQN